MCVETSTVFVNIPQGSSGTFTDLTGFGSVQLVTISERFESFYVDWNDDTSQWKGDWYSEDQLVYQFVPDNDAFEDAVRAFKHKLKSILDAL